MNKSKVRCWKMENWRKDQLVPDVIYITYPEENTGHDLVTCLRCGHVYAVSIAKMVYVGPDLKQKLKGVTCINCSAALDVNYAPYPENYFVNGQILKFDRPLEIPSDPDSLVVEFDEIY